MIRIGTRIRNALDIDLSLIIEPPKWIKIGVRNEPITAKCRTGFIHGRPFRLGGKSPDYRPGDSEARGRRNSLESGVRR
jgi:hypothetical protein